MFVCFSSVSGLLGNAGQASYGAASNCLDALARVRRRDAMAGVSVQWGAWAKVGMAAQGDAARTFSPSVMIFMKSARCATAR